MVDVCDWYVRFSEPVRIKPRRYADHFNRNATGWINATSQKLSGWYSPLSEPVRRKAPLPLGAMPHLFENIPYSSYRFALTEAGDSMALSFSSYTRKNLARVSIAEIQIENMASVTIIELRRR